MAELERRGMRAPLRLWNCTMKRCVCARLAADVCLLVGPPCVHVVVVMPGPPARHRLLLLGGRRRLHPRPVLRMSCVDAMRIEGPWTCLLMHMAVAGPRCVTSLVTTAPRLRW